MANLANVVTSHTITPLQSQLDSFDRCTASERKAFVHRAEEACRLVCDVIAPEDGEKLFDAVKGRRQIDTFACDVGLQSLVAAYREAPTKALKTQILSIYAHKFTVHELKVIHEKLSDRQIKKARAQAAIKGPGIPVPKIAQHRVRIEKVKLDHFLEFTSRPYFYQDVAFGSRKIKLDSGEELMMPNIVRTVSRCTIINQYIQFCNNSETDNFVPLSRSTMWRVLELQEASQRKSLKGLDNTAAEGAEGFESLHKIVGELEEVGANSEWCSQTRKKLHDGKLYLKTRYRDHCQENPSNCPDHCRALALSDISDVDYQIICNHNHDIACGECESLKDVIHEIQSGISEHSSEMNKEQEGDLRYNADAARA